MTCAHDRTPGTKDLTRRGFERWHYVAQGIEHDVYVKGSGPPVLVLHELPGLAEPAVCFAERLIAAGFEVYLPHLFGALMHRATLGNYARLCVSREFARLRAGVEAPVTVWLRALAGAISERAGGGPVGAIGMCLTGAFVIPLILHPSVKAAVSAQPAIPLSLTYIAMGRGRGPWMRELNVPDAQLDQAAARVRAEGLSVLAFRFKADRICPAEKMGRLREAFGDRLEAHELDSPPDPSRTRRPHAVLTEEYCRAHEGDQATRFAAKRVVEFLAAALGPHGDG